MRLQTQDVADLGSAVFYWVALRVAPLPIVRKALHTRGNVSRKR
jgi:hypothetical protein